MTKFEASLVAAMLNAPADYKVEALFDRPTDSWIVVAGPLPDDFPLSDEEIQSASADLAPSAAMVHVARERNSSGIFIMVTDIPGDFPKKFKVR